MALRPISNYIAMKMMTRRQLLPVALDDDPGAGVTDRWGDTLVVRGAGANTQVLLASRGNGAAGNGTNLCILTTTDGIGFTANVLHVGTTNVSDLGLGLAFGVGNTAWAKSNDGTTRGLYHLSFDISQNSAVVLTNYTNFSAAVTTIGANQAGNLLAGIAIETPNDIRLYDISNLAVDPVLIDWDFFYANRVGQPVGSVVFGNNRIYALNANNGILALQLAWPPLNFVRNGDELILELVRQLYAPISRCRHRPLSERRRRHEPLHGFVRPNQILPAEVPVNW